MPVFKIGVIKKQVVKEYGTVEIEADTAEAAARMLDDAFDLEDEFPELRFDNEDLINTETTYGHWPDGEQWVEIEL